MGDKIFYLDDEKINTLVFRRSLAKYYDIHTFNCFADFSEALQNSTPDLIVLDLLMPDINGFEVAKILRNSSRFRLTPILVLTALEQSEDLVECFSLGVDDFVVKPPNFVELRARIDSLVKKFRTSQEYAKQRRMLSLKQLIHGFNHEFNNHLTILQSGVEILKMKSTDADDLKKHDILLRTIQRSADLLRELSLIAGPDSQLASEQPIKELMDSCINHVGRVCHPGVEVLYEGDWSSAAYVALSGRDFCKILTELLSNARDSYYLKPDEHNSVLVHSSIRGNVWRISVQDYGCGIAAEELQHVFDPFFTTKGSLGGKMIGDKKDATGLGLTYVEAVVKNAGGSVELFSEKGKGTEAVLELPVVSQIQFRTVSTYPPFSIKRASNDERLRICMVDSNEERMFAWKQYFRFQGIDVECFSSCDKVDRDALFHSLIIRSKDFEGKMEEILSSFRAKFGKSFPILLLAETEERESLEFLRMEHCLAVLPDNV